MELGVRVGVLAVDRHHERQPGGQVLHRGQGVAHASAPSGSSSASSFAPARSRSWAKRRTRTCTAQGYAWRRHGCLSRTRRAPDDRTDRRPRRPPPLHRLRHRDRAALRRGRPPGRPGRAPRRARRVPVHPRHPQGDVPPADLDDAPVRGLRERQGVQRALPLPARARRHRPVDGLRPAHPARPRLRRLPLPRGGRPHRRGHRHDRRHADGVRPDPARPGLDVDDDQRPGQRADAPLRTGRRGAGRREPEAPRHHAERRAQGVHRPRELHLPARGRDAPDDGSLRVLQGEPPEVEHDLHLGLPLPREGLLGRPGGRLHAGQRDRLRAGRGRRRPRRRRLRPAPGVLLQRPQQRLPGGREVPRRPQDVGRDHVRALRRQGPEVAAPALPHADRRRDADRPAGREQRLARRAAGLRRRLRRHPVAAHQRLRRGARAARPSAPRGSPCAPSRSSPTSPARPTRSTRSPAPTSSRR